MATGVHVEFGVSLCICWAFCHTVCQLIFLYQLSGNTSVSHYLWS